jgi:probable F420-dependent oxidoreductase
MKFSLELPINCIAPKGEFQSMAAVREIAQAVERAGIDGAWVSDHPIPSAHWLHNDPTGHDALDPFAALGFVAAFTTRLKVVANVIVLPYRNPFLTAKSAATLQTLSDGRLILGVGAGYQKVEFEALGVPFSQRGALSDEALEVIRLAWAGGAVVKKGRYFNAVGNEPRPIPSPPPPIWVGGGSEKAVERAARWGDGWAPFFSLPTNDENVKASIVSSIDNLKEKIARIHEHRARFNRTGPFDIYVGAQYRLALHARSDRATEAKGFSKIDAERYIAAVHDIAKAGATWARFALPAPSRAGYLEHVAWFGEEVLPHVGSKAAV